MSKDKEIVNLVKKCSKCKIEKELKYFSNNIGMKDGKSHYCKNCKSIYVREQLCKYTGRTEEQVRKSNIHEYSGKIIDGMKTCSHCNEWKNVNNFAKGNSNCGLNSICKTCDILRSKINNRILKMEFILAYGGYCQCPGCDEKRIDFLTIEHIKNKGFKLIYDATGSLIRKLKALGWPKGYTVFCWNCNLSTRKGFPCPHSDNYKDYETQLESVIRSNKIRNKYFKLKQQLIL